MAKESTRMPMGSAGITTYFDEYRSKIEFKPGHVIVMAIVIILIIVALHLWAGAFLA
jgi:preprotein translocase subunit Sec61beta